MVHRHFIYLLMFKKNKSLIILLFIVAIAAVLRFWKLDQFPVALNWDEASHGYNAYSILKTGKDEWGKTLPLIFKAFGDYKLPLYIYLTTIPVAIFGLNTFSVRFISALAGTLAIIGIYLLANVLFKEKKLKFFRLDLTPGHLTAFLLALTPWHVFISRPALEANLGLTLVIFAAYFLVRALKTPKFYIYASLLLGLSMHTYNTERVFVPLFILAFVFIFRRKIKLSKNLFISIGIFLVFTSIVLSQVISGTGTARYGKLEILSQNAVYQIGQDRLNSKLPKPLPTLLHNRPVYFVETAVRNYLKYFSVNFLYQYRGVQTQFAIPIKNLFSLPITILFLVGFFWALRRLREGEYQFVFAWFFLSPVAASLTADPPQALRPNPMIPVVVILAALGWLYLMRVVRPVLGKAILITVILSVSLALYRYLDTYYDQYAREYSESWQYGYQQAMDYVNSVKYNYDRIIITKAYGEPHIFYAFYSRLDPKDLWPGADNIRFEKSDWFWTDKVDNVYFANKWDIPDRAHVADKIKLESGGTISAHNSLLVTTFNYLPQNAQLLKEIDFLDGTVAFLIAYIP